MKNANERLDRRVNLATWMDDFILSEISDEKLLKIWEDEGFHDGMDMDDIHKMVEDEEKWMNIVDTFGIILDNRYVMEGKKKDECA